MEYRINYFKLLSELFLFVKQQTPCLSTQKIKDKSFAVFFHTEYHLISKQLYCRRKVQSIVKLSNWMLYRLHTCHSQSLDYWQFFPKSGSQATTNHTFKTHRLTLLDEQQKTTGQKGKAWEITAWRWDGPWPARTCPAHPSTSPGPEGRHWLHVVLAGRTWVKDRAQAHCSWLYPKK